MHRVVLRPSADTVKAGFYVDMGRPLAAAVLQSHRAIESRKRKRKGEAAVDVGELDGEGFDKLPFDEAAAPLVLGERIVQTVGGLDFKVTPAGAWYNVTYHCAEWRVQVSSRVHLAEHARTPQIMVTFSAEGLHSRGIGGLVQMFYDWLARCETKVVRAELSRLDVCCDIASDAPGRQWSIDMPFVTYGTDFEDAIEWQRPNDPRLDVLDGPITCVSQEDAGAARRFWSHRQITGWAFGRLSRKGVQVVIYNKVVQARKFKIGYVDALWQSVVNQDGSPALEWYIPSHRDKNGNRIPARICERGELGAEPLYGVLRGLDKPEKRGSIWRNEVRMGREPLIELGYNTIGDLVERGVDPFYAYITQRWFRVVEDDGRKKHRERLRTDPYWHAVQAAVEVTPTPWARVEKVLPTVHEDQRAQGVGALKTFLAGKQLIDPKRALPVLLDVIEEVVAGVQERADRLSAERDVIEALPPAELRAMALQLLRRGTNGETHAGRLLAIAAESESLRGLSGRTAEESAGEVLRALQTSAQHAEGPVAPGTEAGDADAELSVQERECDGGFIRREPVKVTDGYWIDADLWLIAPDNRRVCQVSELDLTLFNRSGMVPMWALQRARKGVRADGL